MERKESIFDQAISREGINTLKWEYEIARTGNPNLIGCGTADMDFRSPKPILDAICEVVENGHLGYQYISDDYYLAIEKWLNRLCGWEIEAKKCVSTNVGIYTAAWCAVDALTEPGDEIIIQTPVHFCFNELITTNGRETIMNPLKVQDNRYLMDFEHLESCFSEKTKMLWLCNPHNPVGRAWTSEELGKIADMCIKRNVKIMSDDVYCGMTYPGQKYVPVSMVASEVSQISVILYSASKIYNTTGLKHAFIVTENPDILRKYNQSVRKLQMDYGMNIMGVAATKAAFNDCDDWVSDLMEYIEGNYRFVVSLFKEELPCITVAKPDATYFAWLDFSCLPIEKKDRAKFFDEEAQVVVALGDVLGKGGEGHVRLNLGCSRSLLEKAVSRIITACKNYL